MLLILAMWAVPCTAQFRTPSLLYGVQDSVQTPTVTPDSTQTTTETPKMEPFDELVSRAAPPTGEYEPTKSSWGAVLRSAIVPGWGQIYVESYWKAPLAFGVAAFLMFNVIDNNNQYIDADAELANLAEDDALFRQTKLRRDVFRDRRDEFIFYLAGVYAIVLIDAYVGANLYDFDVSDDLSASIQLHPLHGTASLSLTW